MNYKRKSIITDQNYFYKLLKKYPKIKSGRKNYKDQYERIVRNILLTKIYFKFFKNSNDIFNNRMKIFKKKF